MEIHTQTLISVMKHDDFEYGMSSNSDILIQEHLSINKIATMDWLNSIYVNHPDEDTIILGLLRIISRIDYDIAFPIGPRMAIEALSHKNIEIQDCGIRAFENWENKDNLPFLKNIQMSQEWLQKYLEQVIKDLEEQ